MTYRTPILMYHALGGSGEKPSRSVMPIRRFAQQMAWLKRMNYHVLSLEEYLLYQRQHRLPLARAIGSRVELEQELGTPIHVFAYPYGEADATAQAVVEQAVFIGNCGMKEGLNASARCPHALRRIEVLRTDSLLDFAPKLRSGKSFQLHRRGRKA